MMELPYTEKLYGWWRVAYFQIVRWKDGSSTLYNFGLFNNWIRCSFGIPYHAIPFKWAVGR